MHANWRFWGLGGTKWTILRVCAQKRQAYLQGSDPVQAILVLFGARIDPPGVWLAMGTPRGGILLIGPSPGGLLERFGGSFWTPWGVENGSIPIDRAGVCVYNVYTLYAKTSFLTPPRRSAEGSHTIA